MNRVTYYAVNLKDELTEEDFGKAISIINESKFVILNNVDHENKQASLFYENTPHQTNISLREIEPVENLMYSKLPKKRIVIECDKTDFVTPGFFKSALKQLGLRIFSKEMQCLLPRQDYIADCVTFTNENHEKVVKTLKHYNLTPVFVLGTTYSYYAKSVIDEKIYFINDNLLYHLLRLEKDYPIIDELYYKVAENIEDFVRKFDFELIPTEFYKYYKRSFKIINYSDFNIYNPGRKVFIKPYILEFESNSYDFFKIAWDQSALLYMDKIRPGENLDKAILRILREELKISHDYIGATVAKILEYDLDKENKLTPRLVVRIFVENAALSEQQKSQKNRTWVSFDQVKKG